MVFEALATSAIILLGLTSLTLLLVKEWRIIFPALALQYVGVSLLVGISWPVGMALVKWITGWIVGILLVMGVISLPVSLRKEYETSAIRFSLTNLPDLFFENIHTIAAALFRFFAAALAIMTCLSISPQLADWFPGATSQQIAGAAILIGLGLLQIGFTSRALQTTLGLLTILSGFEIVYAALESSAMIAGLLATADLGLALAGAYLIVAPTMEETE